MWSILVIIFSPFFSQFTHFFDVPEDICIQYGPAITAIEAFHIAILDRFTWLTSIPLYFDFHL